MCKCVNVEIGSYSNQVKMKTWWNNEIICVDKCLSGEVISLWDNKIHTAGCCCGHNKIKPMINVLPEYHNKMIKLGYKYWINEHKVICYKPKSI